jgi:hypothetical protein
MCQIYLIKSSISTDFLKSSFNSIEEIESALLGRGVGNKKRYQVNLSLQEGRCTALIVLPRIRLG